MNKTTLTAILVAIFLPHSLTAAIDTATLTRGGWTTSDDAGCYFFDSDGSGTICGYLITPMTWEIAPGDILSISYGDGFTEYITDVNGSTMFWRDGQKAYHQPFAEKDDEIRRREGRHYRNSSWCKPHSANTLAGNLYPNSWVNQTADIGFDFLSPDTCSITLLNRKNINEKFIWHSIDSSHITLTAIAAPHVTQTLEITSVSPYGFDAIIGDSLQHFIPYVFSTENVIQQTYRLCTQPLGLYDFFTLPPQSIQSYLNQAYPESHDAPDCALYIGGYKWRCSGVNLNSRMPHISYNNTPADNESVQHSFALMGAILSHLFTEGRSSLGEHTRVFYAPLPGSLDPQSGPQLQILLIKTTGSDAPDSWLKQGCVTLDIRPR